MKLDITQVFGFFDFSDVYDEIIRQAPANATIVEVGTLFGKSAFYMADRISKTRRDVAFYAIDNWMPPCYQTFDLEADLPRVIAVAKHGSYFQVFAHYLERSELSQYIRVLRMDSALSAQHFQNIHAAFIDADHSYEAAKRDILAWYPKIAPGGILAGHDYDMEEVKGALSDCAFPEKIQLVGKRSWMLTKQI